MNSYSKNLNDQADRQSKWKYMFSLLVLFCLIWGVFSKGDLLYRLSLLALVFHMASWYMSSLSKRSRELALEFQKISMLRRHYSEAISEFEVSHLKSKVSVKIAEKSDFDETSIKNNLNPSSSSRDFVLNVQENSFWNHHLFLQYHNLLRSMVLIIVFVVVLLVFYFYPYFMGDSDYIVLRMIFTFLSLGILYELWDLSNSFKEASSEMLELDNEISRIILSERISPSKEFTIFSKYNHILQRKLPAFSWIYNKNKNRLNESWENRLRSNDL